MNNVHTTILTIIFFVLTIGGVFYPVILEDKVLLSADEFHTLNLPFAEGSSVIHTHNHFLRDAYLQYYPHKYQQVQSLHEGSFIAWTPLLFAGHPHYASVFAHFDITNITHLLIELPFSWNLQIILRLIIGAVGMYYLLTVLRIQPNIAFIGGLAFGLNSLFITTSLHQWVVSSFCWMPFALGSFIRYMKEQQARYLMLASLFLGIAVVSGQQQTAAMVSICFAFVSATFLIVYSRFTIKNILALAGVFLTAFSIAAVYLIPAVELFSLSFHNRIIDKVFALKNTFFSIPLLSTFILPELSGTPQTYDITKLAGATMGDFNAFAGVIFPLLVLTFGVRTWKSNPDSRAFIVLMIAGIVLPIFTPLGKYLYHRFFLLYIIGVIVTGSMILQNILSKQEYQADFMRKLRWIMIAFGIFCLGILAWTITFELYTEPIQAKIMSFFLPKIQQRGQSLQEEQWMIERATRVAPYYTLFSSSMLVPVSAGAILLLALYGFLKKHISAQILVSTIGVVTLVHLAFFVHSWMPMTDMQKYPLYPTIDELQSVQSDSSTFRVTKLQSPGERMFFHSNILSMYGIEEVSGYESLIADGLWQITPTVNNTSSMEEIQTFASVAGLCNIKYVLTTNSIDLPQEYFSLLDSGSMKVYQNHLAMPRAFMVYNHEVIQDSKSVRAMMNKGELDRSIAYFTESPTELIQHEGMARNDVQILEYKGNSVSINVETEKAGYLILADNHYPGWNVYVDEKPAQLMEANYAMRAVVIPEGKHIVEFRFESTTVQAGKWISMISLLGILGAIGFLSFRKQ